MDKILISACFLGENVRYDAQPKKLHHHLIKQWLAEKRLIILCPEVSGGLPTPRPPAEIQDNEIITVTGVNVSDAFNRGAHNALALCQQHNIRFALLKESSPSCGSQYIYDGTFSNHKVVGQGITTRLLSQHGIRVFSEQNIEDLALINLNSG
jgi:uncharacterized protein YbbK (DUF523 family)